VNLLFQVKSCQDVFAQSRRDAEKDKTSLPLREAKAHA